MTCQWTELSIGRSFRPVDRGLFYSRCKAVVERGKAFCPEHQQRFDFLNSRPRAGRSGIE